LLLPYYLFGSRAQVKRLSRALCLVKNNAPRSARLNTHSKLFSRSSDKKESSPPPPPPSDYRLLFFSRRVHISFRRATLLSVALFFPFISYITTRHQQTRMRERLDTCYSFEVRDCSLSAFLHTGLSKR
jgi:hypothetical protein